MPADLDLARRAVAASGWDAPRIMWEPSFRAGNGVLWFFHDGGAWLPSLTDSATIGVLETSARDRWPDCEIMPYVTHTRDGDPAIWYRLERIGMDGWCTLTHTPVMHPGDPNRYLAGATRVEAAIAALEVSRG